MAIAAWTETMRQPTENWIDRICVVCSKQFKVMPWRAKKKNGALYCSISCLPQNQKGKIGECQEKEKNGNWKGGLAENRYRYKLIEKQRYPEKVRAREAVQKAKKSGKLIVEPCNVCNSTESIHAHHEDYSKPLDVIWLCSKCHHEKHN
jgi:hypothetical protein